MSNKSKYCPEWSWWIRVGERLTLGVAVAESLKLGMPCKKRRVADGLEQTLRELEAGRSVAEALRQSGMQLPMEAWCLLESGERTGGLGEAIREVGELLRSREDRRREVIGQLWYPALVGVTACVVMGLILLWVIPQMREVGTSMNMGELPWLTEHIGHFYGGASAVFVFVAALLGLVTSLLRVLGGRDVRWGRLEEQMYRGIPGVRSIRWRLRESRLLRQLATLLRGGMTLPRSLELAATGYHSQWEKDQLQALRSRLLIGAGFLSAFQDCGLIGAESVALLEVGQESGRLDSYMLRISRDLEAAAAERMKALTRLLEPAFLLVLSVAVGGLILAYLLPMVRMMEQAGGGF